MSIKLKGSSDGSVSLTAPADTSPSGSDITLTLPTTDGDSNQLLQTNGSGTLSWANKGKVLKVEHSSSETNVTATQDEVYVDIPPNAGITTVGASSKILVHAHTNVHSGVGTNPRVRMRLVRTVGGTNTTIAQADEALVDYGSVGIHVQGVGFSVLDNPGQSAGTAITYHLEFANSTGNGNVGANNNGRTDITMMEIEA